MTIGERIKEKRKELDISVDRLAEILGKNRATIYRYESDDIENLPISILEPLASALYTTPAYLMGWNLSDEENTTEYVKEETNNYIIDEYNYKLKSITELLNADSKDRLYNYAVKLLDLQAEDDSVSSK